MIFPIKSISLIKEIDFDEILMQADAPPPGHFLRLGKPRAQDDLILRKRDRMRRWLCCTCQVEESYPSNENGLIKNHNDHNDGMFFIT